MPTRQTESISEVQHSRAKIIRLLAEGVSDIMQCLHHSLMSMDKEPLFSVLTMPAGHMNTLGPQSKLSVQYLCTYHCTFCLSWIQMNTHKHTHNSNPTLWWRRRSWCVSSAVWGFAVALETCVFHHTLASPAMKRALILISCVSLQAVIYYCTTRVAIDKIANGGLRLTCGMDTKWYNSYTNSVYSVHHATLLDCKTERTWPVKGPVKLCEPHWEY